MGNIEDIKEIIKKGNFIIGASEVMKALKSGKVKKIFLTINCSESIKEDIKQYSKINDVKVIQLNVPNDELGALCRKSFSVSVSVFVRERQSKQGLFKAIAYPFAHPFLSLFFIC